MHLNERVLENERLGLRVRHNPFQIRNPGQERGRLAIAVPVFLKIGAHALPQRTGLAHIEHLAVAVTEYIDARTRRQGLQFGFQLLHAGCSGFGTCLNFSSGTQDSSGPRWA